MLMENLGSSQVDGVTDQIEQDAIINKYVEKGRRNSIYDEQE